MLFSKLVDRNIHFTYVIENTSYDVPTDGQVMHFADMGFAESLARPGFNFAVVRGQIYPITKLKGPATTDPNDGKVVIDARSQGLLDGGNVIMPMADGTFHWFEKENLAATSGTRSHDFRNTLVYPKMDNYNDIVDVLRMFIGGERTLMQGHHDPPLLYEENELAMILKHKYGNLPRSSHTLVLIDDPKLFRADLMFHFIYSIFKNTVLPWHRRNSLDGADVQTSTLGGTFVD